MLTGTLWYGRFFFYNLGHVRMSNANTSWAIHMIMLVLFSYFEYTGSDFSADIAKMAADPMTQKWWDVCKPCHEPLADRAADEWWAVMEEAFIGMRRTASQELKRRRSSSKASELFTSDVFCESTTAMSSSGTGACGGGSTRP